MICGFGVDLCCLLLVYSFDSCLGLVTCLFGGGLVVAV